MFLKHYFNSCFLEVISKRRISDLLPAPLRYPRAPKVRYRSRVRDSPRRSWSASPEVGGSCCWKGDSRVTEGWNLRSISSWYLKTTWLKRYDLHWLFCPSVRWRFKVFHLQCLVSSYPLFWKCWFCWKFWLCIAVGLNPILFSWFWLGFPIWRKSWFSSNSKLSTIVGSSSAYQSDQN